MNELTEKQEPKIHAPAVMIAGEIAEERLRQIEREGYTIEHDDHHGPAELAAAAGVYALQGNTDREGIEEFWPWELESLKPKNRRRDLVRAGALIVAAIEAHDREASDSAGGAETWLR